MAQSRGSRRPLREKVQLRAALVLEEAGELLEAARLYEHSGEHDHAAALRLEHARTIIDQDEQLAVLRQACACVQGEGASVEALHARLAQALGERATASTDAVRRHQLLTEQAQHLELAGLGAAAGKIYETLGELERAAAAYQQAGAITELELVYANIEEARRQADAQRSLAKAIAQAWRTGQRRDAWTRLVAASEAPAANASGFPSHHDLAVDRERLSMAFPTRQRCTLRWRLSERRRGVVHVCAAPRLLIGRSPTADIPLAAPDLSREHVWIELDTQTGLIVARDPGSRAGTFWQGSPLEPDETMPLSGRGELGLGISTAVDVRVYPSSHGPPAALLLSGSDSGRWLFLPGRAPLRLDVQLVVAATLVYDEPFFVLTPGPDTAVVLNKQPLRRGTSIELLLGDVVELPFVSSSRGVPASAEPLVLEVEA